MTPKQAKALVGRTIVAVDLNASWQGEGLDRVRMHNPTIHLDDGTAIRFLVEEHPEGAEYGVDLVRTKRAMKPCGHGPNEGCAAPGCGTPARFKKPSDS